MYDKLDKYVRWCDNGWFPFNYGIVKDRKDFIKCLDVIGIKKHPMRDGGRDHEGIAAHVSPFRDHNDNLLILVLIEDRGHKENTKEFLVHEAVHIWQAMCEEIGEESPSAEFEAYSIQAITRSLWRAYDEVFK